MAEPLHVVEHAAGTPLDQALRAEAAKGGRVVVFLSASWAPPCRVLNQSLAEPAVAELLAGTRMVVVDVDKFGGELQALGMKVTGVPALCAWDAQKGVLSWLSGNAWGKDTVENIAAALGRWIPTLPPLPEPQPPGAQKALAVVGVVVGLALLVAAAVWQVTSQKKASQAQADQEMRESIQKNVSKSVQEAMKKGGAPAR